ncbi:MAG TPA: protein phosphatase 2C domain-containing protein [Vicinamibacterales bacterium]|nr:protein phosphatase 2C domain-containing protein [Vicinamibacterales bacterium]
MTDAALLAHATRLNAAAATDPGRVRTGNEDRHYVDLDRGVLLVVDGVGGHAAGEVAAAIAVDVITQRLDRPIGTPAQRVREAIALANNEILRQAERSPTHAGMTCVLTLALLIEDRLTIGHVGDSRLYTLSSDGLGKLTHDHSPVGEREDAQEISEADAMVHPRRNEVFRDVGSAFHEPDDPDFIELIETRLEPDAAILICSDGLTDLIPSTVIERTIRQHAGDPGRVVSTLIAAANDAGGKDNITVVYAEGSGFPKANLLPEIPAATNSSAGNPASHVSRLTWLASGIVAGLLGGLVLSAWLGFDLLSMSRRARTLVVDRNAPAQYQTITAAVTAAAAGDVVQLEPGEYAEPVVLKDGVDLIARVPGTATLVAPSGFAGWTSIIANGRLGNRIAGIRLLGRATAPLGVALRLAGHDLVVEDVTIEGAVQVGIEVLNPGAIAIRSSQFADVQGLPIRINAGAQPDVRQNLFVRKTSPDARPAIEVSDSGSPQLNANLFVGYANAVQWTSGGTRVVRDNFFIREPGNGR